MAITSEIIGKLGGRVEEVPVSGTASGASGSVEILYTVEVPEGETWLVAAIGQKIGGNSITTNKPGLQLGDVNIPVGIPDGTYGLATVASGTISFSIERKVPSGTDSFTGHVYTAKL